MTRSVSLSAVLNRILNFDLNQGIAFYPNGAPIKRAMETGARGDTTVTPTPPKEYNEVRSILYNCTTKFKKVNIGFCRHGCFDMNCITTIPIHARSDFRGGARLFIVLYSCDPSPTTEK